MVKIGVVVDGDAESQALKLITRRMKIKGTNLLDPRFADIQPRSTAKQIARSAANQITILKKQKADVVIILVDHEDRMDCPGDWAIELENAFKSIGHQDVSVAIKNRKFENWLIADVNVFRKLKSRYKVTKAFENAVRPDKADSVVDAERLINQIVIKSEYHKRRDAAKIAQEQDIEEVGKHSRSFRRFLRLIGHPGYHDQSKKPKPKH